MKLLLIYLVKVYIFLKPTRTAILSSVGITAHSCRHTPSCSQYAINSIRRYGTIKGSWLAFKQILNCHNFYPRH